MAIPGKQTRAITSPNAIISRIFPCGRENRVTISHRRAPPSSCGHVVYKQCSPAETLRGIENKLEYERLETERVIRQHGITRFQRNPSFLVNTLPIMRGAIAAEMTTPT
jgi:2-hydroxychromene-2-carboxylate isomerase